MCIKNKEKFPCFYFYIFFNYTGAGILTSFPFATSLQLYKRLKIY